MNIGFLLFCRGTSVRMSTIFAFLIFSNLYGIILTNAVKVQATEARGKVPDESVIVYTINTYEYSPMERPFEVKVTGKGNTSLEVGWKWESTWYKYMNAIKGPLRGFKIKYWCSANISNTLKQVDIYVEDVMPIVHNYTDKYIQSAYLLTNITRCHNMVVEIAAINYFTSLEKPDPRPPNILKQPLSNVVFYVAGQQVKLLCRADGQPKPKYKWTRNGKPYSLSTSNYVRQVDGEGTLVFIYPQFFHAGIYQCKAENKHGVSVTDKIDFREAKLDSFFGETHNIEVGASLTLPCNSPLSVPRAEISWVLIDDDQNRTPVNTDDRVSIDIEGRLRFANVKKSDGEGKGKSYSCSAKNYVLGTTVYGPKHIVKVFGNKTQTYPVKELYISPHNKVFLKGETLRLQCIFAGNPTPKVIWKNLNNTLPDRARFENGGQELQIDDLRVSDAGWYQCTVNSRTIIKKFNIRIESSPYLVEELKNVKASVDEEAKFVCKADGIPKPHITWYINGKPLDSSIGKRFSMKEPYALTIANLTWKDQMNIQCNASNKHGYVFSDVFLDIIDEYIQKYTDNNENEDDNDHKVNDTDKRITRSRLSSRRIQ